MENMELTSCKQRMKYAIGVCDKTVRSQYFEDIINCEDVCGSKTHWINKLEHYLYFIIPTSSTNCSFIFQTCKLHMGIRDLTLLL